jgi:20S proteasome subunit beta 4
VSYTVSLDSYSIDLYGTKAILPYAAQGLGIYVALSTMDKYWYPDITREEAIELLRKCIAEVKLRESLSALGLLGVC